MTYLFIAILLIMLAFSVYCLIVTRQSLEMVQRQSEITERREVEWLEERKDLYSRIMSRDLSDYIHHSEKKAPPKTKKSTNYLEEYRTEAYRNMD